MTPVLAKQNNTAQENVGIYLCLREDIGPSISLLKSSKPILFFYVETIALCCHVSND